MATFNISTKAVSDTSILHLIDPATDQPMYADEAEQFPLEIEVYGRASKQFRNWQAASARKDLARGKKQKTAEESRESTADFLATLSKNAPNIDLDGEALNNYDSFKKLYMNPSLFWIGDQVAERLNDTESFLQK